MRHRPTRSRIPTLSPLLAAGALIGWTTGCAGLPSSLSALRPPAEQVAATEGVPADPNDDETANPVPPIAPPDEPLPTVAAAPATLRSPATEALIAEELSLAPIAERPQLSAEWAKLDEAMVEQVIRIRRMVRQLDAQSAARSAAAVAAATPAHVHPPGPHQWPVDVAGAHPSPLYDPGVQTAAYVAPAPPADRGGASRTTSPYPGLPPAPRPDRTALPPPPRPLGQPLRTAEALPTPAALRAPTPLPGDSNSANPLYDPGPTGFGAARPLPGSGIDDFAGRLEALQQTARRRADRAAQAVRAAVDPEEKAAAVRQRAAAEIDLRLLHLLAGEHDRVLEVVPGLPSAEQEFWQHTFWALSTEMDTRSIPDPADRATHAVAALRTAAVKLSERANLVLKDVNFCHRVDSFGNVQTFERDEFTPNEPVLIYAAVENFASERTLEGRFRTVLRSKVEIFRAGGTELVDTLPLDKPVTVDLCDNHRQDYFLIYELKIPARIGLGPHVLKLTVEDTLGDATAETELNFTVR